MLLLPLVFTLALLLLLEAAAICDVVPGVKLESGGALGSAIRPCSIPAIGES